MQMINIESSNIAAVGYSDREKELYIQFNEGRIYRYMKVPAVVYVGLLASKSKGRYFSEQIRDFFQFEQCDEEDVEAA